MRFKWTIKELEDSSDLFVLRTLVTERKSTCTNVYSPLYKRLCKIEQSIENLLSAGKTQDAELTVTSNNTMLDALKKLATCAKRINDIQHCGDKVSAEEWSDLYQYTNDAFAAIADAEGGR